MTRHFDWKPRLLAYLTEVAGRPFVFGSFDCLLFTLGALAAMTGEDLRPRYQGRYHTLAAGIALLRRDGHRDHVALIASLFDEVPPSFAQVGDVAVVSTPDGPALGVVQGEYIYVLGPDRMHPVSLLTALRAFRVS